ncbi:ArsR/SmtB family transcription factor [Nonomuraea endophytica]|uniref:DNA-binding transcriptional ArsR family regulator n=1 Tax=Nonomuraea endophytica TaxID=714136 RepID=A0A7W8EMB3_9ACTN|nr:metalloregulator ArsR/SmtB family transcription factor [Nonomuraea endophytica]MBB5084834.1 DNA-binding transcriptional ArsR family regulator [Nonomuraea endophytica]
MSVDAIVEVLKAIADPTRFQILYAVSSQEHGVGQLADKLGAHVAAISQHLAKLRAAGLVTSRRDGTRIYYRAANPHVAALLAEAGLLTGYVTGTIDPPEPPAVVEQQVSRPVWVLNLGAIRPAQT